MQIFKKASYSSKRPFFCRQAPVQPVVTMSTGGEQMSFASNTSAYTLNPHPFTGQTMEPPSSSPSTWTKKRRRRRGGGGRKGSYFLKTSAHSIKNREMEGLNFFLRVQRLMWTSLISRSLINSPQMTREVRPDYSFSKRCLNSVKKRENFHQTFFFLSNSL